MFFKILQPGGTMITPKKKREKDFVFVCVVTNEICYQVFNFKVSKFIAKINPLAYTISANCAMPILQLFSPIPELAQDIYSPRVGLVVFAYGTNSLSRVRLVVIG